MTYDIPVSYAQHIPLLRGFERGASKASQTAFKPHPIWQPDSLVGSLSELMSTDPYKKRRGAMPFSGECKR